MGTIIYSPVSDIPTHQDVPNRPLKPRASIESTPHVCVSGDASVSPGSREVRLKVQWPAPDDNGSKIMKYQARKLFGCE
jgi:hypothetical protein